MIFVVTQPRPTNPLLAYGYAAESNVGLFGRESLFLLTTGNSDPHEGTRQ
jgi:hypothetical protein